MTPRESRIFTHCSEIAEAKSHDARHLRAEAVRQLFRRLTRTFAVLAKRKKRDAQLPSATRP